MIRLGRNLEVSLLPQDLKEEVRQTFSIANPKWLENKRMGRWNGKTPRNLFFYSESPDGTLVLPRGYTRSLMLLLKSRGLLWDLDDRRLFFPEILFRFTGKLKEFQKKAVEDMAAREFGTLNAPTGAGKTVMALALVAKRRQPALIVVHTRELARQWRDRITQFLGIPEDEIGLIGDGKCTPGRAITVALVQSLVKHLDIIVDHVGHLIVDECHRTPSKTFTEAVSAFPARYILGLSATLFRRDNLSPLIFWYLGDAHHVVDKKGLVRRGDILSAEVIFRETDFMPFHDPVTAYAKAMKELTTNRERNQLIASDVAGQCALYPQSISLVLSDRRQHCEVLSGILRYGHKVKSAVLTGNLKPKERKEVMEAVLAGEVQVLVATGQLIGEGFDCKDLSTLFLATPIRFSGRLIQYLGRILRPAPGKERAFVFDYVDTRVEVFLAMAAHRLRVYGGPRNHAEMFFLFD